MTSVIHNINVDCADPYRMALFWAEVTGWTEDPAEGNAPEDPEALLISPDGGLHLLFIAGPDVKTVKNRMHLDLRPTDRTRDEEVTRLLHLGATLIDDRRNPDGTGWAVLGDLEGNEFCIERSAIERSAVERSAAERGEN
ncbi:MAG: VOC family protein [Actinomycetota bacterium]|nr:VOC family protein [Actinomycetota bacterium]